MHLLVLKGRVCSTWNKLFKKTGCFIKR